MTTQRMLAALSASELVERYTDGSLSPVEVTAAVLETVQELDPGLNAFVVTTPEKAMAAARQSEKRWRRGEPCGPIDGVPTSTKDIITVQGLPTRKGSLTTANQPVDTADAPTTRNLFRSGATLIGKTTTPEFGWKAVTDSPLTGVTRNPWNHALTPGGSSGGAAAACAAGMGPLHIGTDGGGSIRIPASFAGIFGLKPTFGRVPAFPHSPFGTLAHIGPMTRTVADAELMLRVLCEHDARDSCAVRPDYIEQHDNDESHWKGKRVGFIERIPGIEVDPEIDMVVRSSITKLEELGATVENITIDDTDIRDVFRMHWYTGARQMSHSFSNTDMNQLDQGLRKVIEESLNFALDDFLQAASRRIEISNNLERLHDAYDVLVSPAVPVKPMATGHEVSDPVQQKRWIDWAQYSYLFNLSQQPAASIPCGFTPDGCPVGLQIVGPRFSDYRLLRLCMALEPALAEKLKGGPTPPWDSPPVPFAGAQ